MSDAQPPNTVPTRIVAAYFEAQRRRPYKANDVLVAAATPGGGNWECVAPEGCITRSIMWNGLELALMNPRGDLDDTAEGQIAMAARALPLMDASLRSIIVLAESADNLDTIRALAVAAIEFIERPAPRVKEPEDDEDPEGDDE
jgi:hypothetical protein